MSKVIFSLIALSVLCLSVSQTTLANTETSTTVSPRSQPSQGDTGSTSSSTVIDPDNLARAVIDQSTGKLGVEARIASLGGFASAQSSDTDRWNCVNCRSSTSGVLRIHLDGVISPNTQFSNLTYEYDLINPSGDTVYRFFFRVTLDDGLSVSSRFTENGTISNVPFTQSLDAQGNFVFSVDFSSNAAFPTNWGDFQLARAEVFGNNSPQLVDFLHTFQVDIISSDPNVWFTSEGGRTTLINSNLPPTARAKNLTVAADNSCSASIGANDVNDGSFDPDSGDSISLSLDQAGPFSLGTHAVTLIATDSHGATSTATATVTVIDNTPPSIAGAAVDKTELRPPNHKMVDVIVSYNLADNCGSPAATLDVASNETVNSAGDGNTAPDWEVVDAHHVRLRAERSGQGAGRIYTITITATDGHGNASIQTVTVRVPHN
jgi:hypothetical protein